MVSVRRHTPNQYFVPGWRPVYVASVAPPLVNVLVSVYWFIPVIRLVCQWYWSAVSSQEIVTLVVVLAAQVVGDIVREKEGTALQRRGLPIPARISTVYSVPGLRPVTV
ncbi:MAG: hypothetical protein OXG67_05615 [bacterium]|nr:hypothetical protein [bacterium]